MTNPRPYRAIPIGKKESKKKFVYGWYVKNGDTSYIFEASWIREKQSTLGAAIEVIPESVGQQVGRQDKHKKEIYAGDKVAREPDKMWGIVVWKDNAQAFLYDLENGHTVFVSAWSEVEITGNIHQEEKP